MSPFPQHTQRRSSRSSHNRYHTTKQASAVSWLHAYEGHGYLHRNIKPSCVMLSHERTAFLSDFGFSVRGDTKLEQVRGSLRYMDPRMFVKDAVPDKAGDVYSYVMLLYELFTEQQPLPIFDDSTSRQQFVHAMRRHKKELLGDMLDKMHVRGLGSSKYAAVVAMIKDVIARGCALEGTQPLTSEMLPAVITDCAFKLFVLPPHLLDRYKHITGNVCSHSNTSGINSNSMERECVQSPSTMFATDLFVTNRAARLCGSNRPCDGDA